MTLREEVREVLDGLGTAYHNNYPDYKAEKEATDQIIALIEAKIPKEKSVQMHTGADNYVSDYHIRGFRDGHNSCLSEIRKALGLG